MICQRIPSVFPANDRLVSGLIWLALVLPVVIATVLLRRGQVRAASASIYLWHLAAAHRIDLTFWRINQPHR